MDCDDNDFQSQNFQLSGEDNNRFPSGLRSFSLPKFDLDEHLQVHLRFDSLVEPDTLLGIQGQEESNWIEGFSPGSSAIEFSSSAAETCSISRHNNVWSEATSSESVEMLLKSVGEDDMINKKTEESDAHDGLDSINDNMDPSLAQDNSLHSKMAGAVNTDPALPPDECQRSLLGLDNDVIGVLPHVGGTALSSKDKSGSGSLIDLDGSSGCEFNSYGEIVSMQCGLNEKLTSSLVNTFQDDARESQHLVDEKCNEAVQNDKLDSTSSRNMQVETSAIPSNPVMHSGKPSNQKFAEQVPEVYAEVVLLRKSESLLTNDNQKFDCQILHKGTEFQDLLSEGHAVKSSLGSPKNPSSIDPNVDSQVFNESVFNGNTDGLLDDVAEQVKIASKGDQILARTHETSYVTVVGERKFEEISVEDTVKLSISALKMNPLVRGTEGFSDVGFHEKATGLLKDDGINVDSMVSIETSGIIDDYGGRELELSMVVMEEKQDTKSYLTENENDGMTSPSGNVCCLDNITHEARVTEIKEDDDNGGVHLRDSTYHNPELEVMEKNAQDQGLENDVGSSEGSLNSAQVMLEKSRLAAKVYSLPNPANEEQVTGVTIDGADLDNHMPDIESHNPESAVTEKNTEDDVLENGALNSGGLLSAPEKVMQEKAQATDPCDVGGAEVQISSSLNIRLGDALEPESCDIHIIPSEVPVLEKECTRSSINSDNMDSRSGVSFVMEKTEDAKSQVQNTATPTAAVDGSPAKEFIQDDAGDVFGHEGVMESNLPTTVSTHLDRNEESVSGISSKPCLSNLEGNSNFQTASGPVSFSDPGQHNLISPEGLLSTMVLQSASSMEKSLQVTCQNSTELEGHPVSFSVMREKGEPEEVGVSSGKYQRAALNISGDALNSNENPIQSVALSKSNAESLALEPESANHNCGSPIVISSCGHSCGETEHQEGNKTSSDRIVPISSDQHLSCSKIGRNFDEVKSTARDSKERNASEDDRSFTFEVGSLPDLSERDTDSGWKPFPSIPSFVLPQPQTGEGSLSTSSLCQSALKVSKESPDGSRLVSGGGDLHGVGIKKTDKNKTRSVSGSGTGKATASKRKPAKETPVAKQTERGGNPCITSVNTAGVISRDMEMEMRRYSYIEASSMKPSCATTVQASNLPDLNAAASLFHQPFTDSQQVQLRAQIFVYGSLIQGTPPDEACMISAFGDTDGGRSIWEGLWHIANEKFHNQKSSVSNRETPSHAHSGIRVPEQVSKCSPFRSKSHNTPTSRTGSKGAPSAIFNSTMCMPSPVWNVTTPRDILHPNIVRGLNPDSNQVLSPLHAYQSSQVRQHTSNGTPRPLQTPCLVPWIASTQASEVGTSTQISALPIAETVQVMPIRDSSVPGGSNMQLVLPSAFPASSVSVSVSAASTMQTEIKRKMISPGPDKNASADQKSKRRKGMVPETVGQVLSVSQTELSSATGATKHLPPSVGLLSHANQSSVVTSSLVSTISPIMSPTHFQIIGAGGSEQKVILYEETSSKIEQAKKQAEDAAASAASAIRHSEGIWSQLASQKNSGLISDADGKLASASVAAAAAASVTKAAAVVAKVASDAAWQAKMMADEATILTKTGNSAQSSGTGYPDGVNNLGRIAPVSLLKGKDKMNGASSIISAAREASRRRLEAASAATKRAEILDAIVKAAELAAEAVSQAGAIIAMGDSLPFTLNDLVEAGPEGYWKVQHSTAEQHGKTNYMHGEEQLSLKSAEGLKRSFKNFNQQPSYQKEIKKITDEGGESSSPSELSKQTTENQTGIASYAVPIEGHERDQLVAGPKENSIQEGSLVEVVSDEDGRRGVWISARVLNLKDGQAYVCYNELLHDKDTSKLKEWIPLEGKGDKAPRIRIAHRIASVKAEGTRKRRRAAVGNYAWAIGDRVDAWIHDGWWEGIVTEKSKEDETKLTVHFPARGDSSVVRAWDLRPSLIWKDGQWMEWSCSREISFQPHEGDTPQEKRQKLGRLELKNDSEVEGIGGDKLLRNLHIEDSRKPGESRPLVLSAKDKIFSVGKSGREENNSDSLRIKRTGLQKEGSRVIFGVPKPGKKRKFMEVSKHYVANNKTEKISERSDSLKFAKYLMPQTSRGWKNTFKVDPKGRQVDDSKPKVLKSVKSQGIQTRSTTERESSSMSIVSASNGRGSSQVSLPNVKVSVCHEENKLEKTNLKEVGMFPDNLTTAVDPVVVSQLPPMPGVPSSRKKSASAVETEMESNGKSTFPDAIEPRRSNRRIQPTSRLLEGLQSSLPIAKILNVSHDKNAMVSHRSASSRGNAHG